MNVKEIRASRQKALRYLAGSLAFAMVIFALRYTGRSSLKLSLSTLFFGFCSVVFTWQVLRPERMVLDDEGFTLFGGFFRDPKKVLWADIQEFVVYRAGKDRKMIGYNFRAGVVRPSVILKLNRRLGAERILAGNWSQPMEKIVAELNNYRLTVLAASDFTGSSAGLESTPPNRSGRDDLQ